MKQLNSFQTWILRIGAILVLLGAMLNPLQSTISPFVYCLGALMFSSMQLLASYDGRSLTIRRLRRQQIIAAFLLILSGAAMFGNSLNIQYVRHNEWMIIMLLAALLELYTSFRIPAELRKEKNKQNNSPTN